MTVDPYSVLGVSPSASKDEIKKAYRSLAKKYHPDANPGNAAAEQKMKEINAAYDAIMNGKTAQEPYGEYGQQRSYRYAGAAGEKESIYMQAARNFINNGRCRDALNVLSTIPLPQRDGKWYYYSAVANARLGNKVQAQQDAQMAVKKEPNNPEYAAFLQRLRDPGRAYRDAGRGFGRSVGVDPGYCLGLCFLSYLCRLCGRC